MFSISALRPRLDRHYHSAEIPIGIRASDDRFEQKSPNETYEDFYKRGGWTYDENIEGAFLLHRILLPLKIRPKCSLLELGCGNGFHSHALSRLGLDVTGVDASRAAIAWARRYGNVSFIHEDASSYMQRTVEHFDVVFVRAMSWFHYELEPGLNCNGVNVHRMMALIVSRIKPNGLFILQVRTDFSGTYDKTGIRNHTVSQALAFLQAFGTVQRLTDWRGQAINTGDVHTMSGYGLLAAIRIDHAV